MKNKNIKLLEEREFLIQVQRVFLITTQHRRLKNKTTIHNNLCSHMDGNIHNSVQSRVELISLSTLELSVLFAIFSLKACTSFVLE